MVYKGLPWVRRGYRGDWGLLEVTGDYKGLQEVTMGVHGVTSSYRGLHVFNVGFRGVTGGYKGLQEVKRG